MADEYYNPSTGEMVNVDQPAAADTATPYDGSAGMWEQVFQASSNESFRTVSPQAETPPGFAGFYQTNTMSGGPGALSAMGVPGLAATGGPVVTPTEPHSFINDMLKKASDFASTDKGASLVGSAVLAGLSEMMTGKTKKQLGINQQTANAATSNAASTAAHVANLESARQNALTSTGDALTGYGPAGSQKFTPLTNTPIQNKGLISTRGSA